MFEGLEVLFFGGRRPGRRSEKVFAHVEGEAPIAGPRVVIESERHPRRPGNDSSLDLGVVGGDCLGSLEIPL